MTTLEKLTTLTQNITHRTYPVLKKGWEWTCIAAKKCAEESKTAYQNQKAKPHVRWFLGLQPRAQIVVAATTVPIIDWTSSFLKKLAEIAEKRERRRKERTEEFIRLTKSALEESKRQRRLAEEESERQRRLEEEERERQRRLEEEERERQRIAAEEAIRAAEEERERQKRAAEEEIRAAAEERKRKRDSIKANIANFIDKHGTLSSFLIIDSNIWMDRRYRPFFAILAEKCKSLGKTLILYGPQFDEICNIKRNKKSPFGHTKNTIARMAIDRFDKWTEKGILRIKPVTIDAKPGAYADPLTALAVKKLS